MYKTLKNIGLGLTLLAGTETATLPNTDIFVKPAQAQEVVKKGLLQLSTEIEGSPGFPTVGFYVGFYLDGISLLEDLNSKNNNTILKLDYGPHILQLKGLISPQEGGDIKGLSNRKIIEIDRSTSRLEVIVDYNQDTREGRMYFSELTDFFDKDDDYFLDDVEQFFGTNDNSFNDNPATRPNIIRIKKEGKDSIFYTQNYNYIPTFSEAKTFEEDIQAYDKKIKELYNERSDRSGEIGDLIGKINRLEKSFAPSHEYIHELKEELNDLEKKYESVNIQVKKLEEEKKDKKYNEFLFLSNSNMFKFEREGNSLKILYKKYEEKEWKDISDQPDFYKKTMKKDDKY